MRSTPTKKTQREALRNQGFFLFVRCFWQLGEVKAGMFLLSFGCFWVGVENLKQGLLSNG